MSDHAGSVPKHSVIAAIYVMARTEMARERGISHAEAGEVLTMLGDMIDRGRALISAMGSVPRSLRWVARGYGASGRMAG